MATSDWHIVLDNFKLSENTVPDDSLVLVKFEHLPESDYQALEVQKGSKLVPVKMIFKAKEFIK